jgi:hypothetical protein
MHEFYHVDIKRNTVLRYTIFRGTVPVCCFKLNCLGLDQGSVLYGQISDNIQVVTCFFYIPEAHIMYFT